MQKSNMPEMTIFYLNQAYQSHKDNKNIYYFDLFILGQVTPFLNPPENLNNYDVNENEAKIFRPKCDTVSRQFWGLVETLGYLAVYGDSVECFLDYGYSKENSKVLYSNHKMKIPNSFSSTLFNRHMIQLNLVPWIRNFQTSISSYLQPQIA